MRGRKIGFLWALGVLGALVAVAAAPGIAATSPVSTTYHPDVESRTFAHGDGGWTSSTSAAGNCTQYSCPALTNSYQASGGVGGAGDGFIRTEIAGLLGVSGEETGVWQSPAFTYRGAEGGQPDLIQLRLYRRVELTNFASASDNKATYTVEVVGAGGPATVVVDNQSLPHSDQFASLGPFSVDPEQLTLGQQYRIRITTRFGFGTTGQPGGYVDYDNVGFKAIDQPDPQGGQQGPRGTPGKNGKGKFDNAFLTSFVKNNMRNWAGVGRKSVHVLIRCPGRAKQQGGVCRFKLTALKHRSGPAATSTKVVRLRAKRKREVALPIKPAFRGELDLRPTILVRYAVRVGKVHTMVFKQLAVVRCATTAKC